MISIIIDRDEDRKIRGIYASGHAGFDDPGRDIVCAGISAIMFAAANALEDICGFDSDDFFRVSGAGTEDVNLRISVPETEDLQRADRAQVIMRTAELGVIGIARDYNDGTSRYVEIINSKTPEV